MEMKKLIKIKELPYTVAISSINAIWGLVVAIILVIASLIVLAIGINFNGSEALLAMFGFSVGAVVSLPILIFLLSLGSNLLYAIVFNITSSKVDPIKVGFDGDKLVKIDPISYGIINAIVSVVISLLWSLAFQPAIYLASAAFEPTQIISLIFSILGTIVGGFIGGFIVGAVFALTYNFIIKFVSGVKVYFEERAHGFDELVKIDPVSLGLSFTLVHTIWTAILTILTIIIVLLISLIVPNANVGTVLIISLIVGIVVIVCTFIISFIALAGSALIYNVLVNKVGGVKLKFEDIDEATETKDIKEI